jgi:hypothetical protein
MANMVSEPFARLDVDAGHEVDPGAGAAPVLLRGGTDAYLDAFDRDGLVRDADFQLGIPTDRHLDGLATCPVSDVRDLEVVHSLRHVREAEPPLSVRQHFAADGR